MQTGNLMKFLIGLTEGKIYWINLLPLLSFIVSTFLASLLNDIKYSNTGSILLQIILAIIVLFLPNKVDFNIISLCLLSTNIGFQFAYFRKVESYTYSGNMNTNNMRILTKTLADFIKGKASFNKVLFYLLVTFDFAFGVISAALLTKAINVYALAVLLPIYLLALVIQFLLDKAN